MSPSPPMRSTCTPPWAAEMNAACVWQTPFGFPVVPDVEHDRNVVDDPPDFIVEDVGMVAVRIRPSDQFWMSCRKVACSAASRASS